jgi:hypothetical protein
VRGIRVFETRNCSSQLANSLPTENLSASWKKFARKSAEALALLKPAMKRLCASIKPAQRPMPKQSDPLQSLLSGLSADHPLRSPIPVFIRELRRLLEEHTKARPPSHRTFLRWCEQGLIPYVAGPRENSIAPIEYLRLQARLTVHSSRQAKEVRAALASSISATTQTYIRAKSETGRL